MVTLQAIKPDGYIFIVGNYADAEEANLAGEDSEYFYWPAVFVVTDQFERVIEHSPDIHGKWKGFPITEMAERIKIFKTEVEDWLDEDGKCPL